MNRVNAKNHKSNKRADLVPLTNIPDYVAEWVAKNVKVHRVTTEVILYKWPLQVGKRKRITHGCVGTLGHSLERSFNLDIGTLDEEELQRLLFVRVPARKIS